MIHVQIGRKLHANTLEHGLISLKEMSNHVYVSCQNIPSHVVVGVIATETCTVVVVGTVTMTRGLAVTDCPTT